MKWTTPAILSKVVMVLHIWVWHAVCSEKRKYYDYTCIYNVHVQHWIWEDVMTGPVVYMSLTSYHWSGLAPCYSPKVLRFPETYPRPWGASPVRLLYLSWLSNPLPIKSGSNKIAETDDNKPQLWISKLQCYSLRLYHWCWLLPLASTTTNVIRSVSLFDLS